MRTIRVSSVPSLVGAWGQDAALQTWAVVRGLQEPAPASFIMRLGSEMTDDILRLSGFPENGAREVFLQRLWSWGELVGHADGIDYEAGTVWEAKLTRRWTHKALNATLVQSTLYAAMAGVSRIRIVVYEIFGEKLMTYDYDFDRELYAKLEWTLQYLFENWDNDQAPLAVSLFTGAPAPAVELPQDVAQAVWMLADELRGITEQLQRLEKEKLALEQRLKEYCRAVGGVVKTGAYLVELKRYTTTVYDIPQELKQQFARRKEVERLVVKVRDEEDSG